MVRRSAHVKSWRQRMAAHRRDLRSHASTARVTLRSHAATARFTVGVATAVIVPGGLQAQTLPTSVTMDGRTDTTAITEGAVTTITTKTRSGRNAVNSFSTFDVAQGSTVNLIVPDAAKVLVNIVRDRAVTINGIVNSFQGGQLGGNVFFADAHGFVVGRSGVVNVGSLTVATPSRAFLDTLVSTDGSVSAGAMTSLIDGSAPQSADGLIRIDGTIRAAGTVRLAGAAITTGGVIAAGLYGHDEAYGALVNTSALVEGTQLVEHGGRIEIVAAGDARIGGSLSTGAGTLSGGTISIGAARDIAVDADTALAANAGTTGTGGSVSLIAGRDLAAADGLSIAARGSSAGGDGGRIELSAAARESIGSARYDASAVGGAAGSVIFDPTNLDITGNQSTVGAAYTVGGPTYGSVHLLAGVTIDTTNGANQAGAISVLGTDITIDGTLNAGTGTTAGAVSLTAANSSNLTTTAFGALGKPSSSITIGNAGVVKGGAVTLGAASDSKAVSGLVAATANVTIAGTVTGNSVAITADATSETKNNASLFDLFGDAAQAIVSLTGIPYLQDGLNDIGTTAVPLQNIGYGQAAATANVAVTGTARITAGAGGVLLRSVADQSFDKAASTGQLIGVVIARVTGTATADVASGATITSGGKLEVAAHDISNAVLPVSVENDKAAASLSLAVLKADVTSTATVHSGAVLSVTGDLSVLARSDTNYDTEVTSAAHGAGKVSLAGALAFNTTTTLATLGADVGAAAAGRPANIQVEASSIGANSIVSAGSITGGTGASEVSGVSDWRSLTDSIESTLIGHYLGKVLETAGGSGSTPKFGSAIAVDDSTAVTRAEIAPTDGVTTAPSVQATGAVSVVANRVDGGLRTDATSEIESEIKKPEAGNPTASYAVSAAIAVDLRTNETLALVAPNATITAGRVGVQANLTVPAPYKSIGSTLANLFDVNSAFSNGVIEGITGIYEGVKDLTDPKTFVTGYAYAKGQGTSGSINGVASYFGATNTTGAWIGSGAQITATDPAATGWTTLAGAGDARLFLDPTRAAKWVPTGADPLLTYAVSGTVNTYSPFTFGKPVDVAATSSIKTIFLTGDRSQIKTSGGAEPAGSSVAVGGVLNMTEVDNTTIAGVAATAHVTSAGGLAINADSASQAYLIAPGAGTGGGIGVTGILALSFLNEATHATLANSAIVSAPTVTINADQAVNLWTATGAISTGKGAGVGLSISVNDVETDTRAAVDDNSADATTLHGLDARAGTSSSAATGTIAANALNVHAITRGQAGALAIALAKAGAGSPGGILSAAKGKVAAINDKITSVKDKLDGLLNPLGSLLDSGGGAAEGNGQGDASSTAAPKANTAASNNSAKQGFSIGIAGAASVGLYNANTSAIVNRVTVNPFTAGGTAAIDVLATRNASFFTLAGGATKVGSGNGQSGSSAAVAGALSLTEDSGNTRAAVTNVTASSAGAVNVQALTGGFTVGAALGAAVDTDQNSAAMSASGTLSFLHGATNAIVAGSTLASAAADLKIRAYNSTVMGLGAGAFSVGGKAAIGATLTLSLIGGVSGTDAATGRTTDFVGAHLVNSTVSAGHVAVVAEAPIRIISAAATAGVSKGPTGVAIGLGGVYSDIGRSIAATIESSIVTAFANNATNTACGDENCGVFVIAGSDSSAALAALIGNPTANNNGDLDLTAGATTGIFGDHSSGAAILAVAGVLQAGRAAVGLSFAGGNIHDNYTATITNSRVTATNSDVAVLTSDNAYIGALSVGAAISTGNPGLAFMGSATVNLITTTDTAGITGGTLTGGTKITAQSVTVKANAGAGIDSLAGNVAGGSGAAIGVAVGYNKIGRTIAANVSGIEVSAARKFAINGAASGRVRTASVAGAASTNAAIGGSFSINTVSDGVSATLGTGANASNISGYTTVAATNAAKMDVLAGAAAVATSGAAVGAAVAVNRLDGTTAATVTGATVRSADLDVLATQSGAIGVISIGAAAGSQAGIGGSIVTNFVNSNIKAAIVASSNVRAANSVSVQASNVAGVYVSSGALGLGQSAGVGLAVTTNLLNATTNALIDGSLVAAAGNGSGRSVSDGTVLRPDGTALDTSSIVAFDSPSAGSSAGQVYSDLFVATPADSSNPVGQMKSLGSGVESIRGLSVNASTRQNVAVLSAALAGSATAAVGADVGATIVGGATRAEITNSTVGGTQGAQGDIDVLASGSAVVGNLIAGVAGSGSVAGAGAVAATSFKQSVIAQVTGTNIGGSAAAAGIVGIRAITNQQTFGLTVGAAASGSLAFAGSGLVNLFSATTTALLRGGTTYARSLVVNADTTDAVGGATGALAVGLGGAGGAGAFDVTYMSDKTSASVGTSNDITATTLNLQGDLTVHAEGHDKFAGIAVSGAGGAAVGISGLANILFIDGSVSAGLYRTTVAPGASRVAVTSLLATEVHEYGGALGVGVTGAGVGVALNMAVIKDAAIAEIVNSTVNATSLDVTADKTRSLASFTASAAAGFAGVGGSISVNIVGALDAAGLKSDDSGDLSGDSSFSGMVGRGDSLASTDLTANNKSLTAADKTKVGTAPGAGVASGLTSAATAATTARLSGSTVTTGGTVTIRGTDATTTAATTGSVAVGAVGVGASVAFTRLRGSIDASTDAGTTITAPTVVIEALNRDLTGKAADVTAFAGAAGVVGLGAAIADIDSKAIVTATAAGTITGKQGFNDALTVRATDSTTLGAKGLGAAVGAAAVGVAAGVIDRSSTVKALIGDNANVSNFNGILISAGDSGSATASSIAAAGGIFGSGAGAVATAINGSTVLAQINTGATTKYGSNGLSLTAAGTSGLSADAQGYAVSGQIGVGASVAVALAKGSVRAIDNGLGHGNSGKLTIAASLITPGEISAKSQAAAGGFLAGAQGSAAYARNLATVEAQLNGNELLPLSAISVTALTNNAVAANAQGLSGGAVSVGAVFSMAEASSTTNASIGSSSVVPLGDNSNNITVTATGTDTITSYAKSGSGGVIAGSAASANTKNSATTTVSIGERVLDGGAIKLDATHTTNYAGAANSEQAAVAGMSAAVITNAINATTTVTVADKAYLIGSDIRINAANVFRSATLPGGAKYAGVGGAGGFANVGAVSIDTTLSGTAKVLVGTGAQLYVLGNPISILQNGDGSNRLTIDASTRAVTSEEGRLEMSGAFQGPFVQANVTGDYINQIDIGADAILHSNGQIGIGANGTTSQNVTANVTVYGLAAAGGGKTKADVESTQTVNIGAGADLLSYGQMRVGAGATSAGADNNSIVSGATTNVYNNTAIPITAILDADAKSLSNNTLAIAAGANLRSVLDVALTAAKGVVTAKGAYRGTNPYLTIFASDSTGGNSSATGTGDLNLGGNVIAGVANKQTVTVSGQTASIVTPLDTIDHTPTRFVPTVKYVGLGQTDTFTPLDDIVARQTELNTEKNLSTTTQERKNAIQGELDLLTALYSDLSSQAANGLATVQTSPIYAAGGDIRINADKVNAVGTAGRLTAQGDATVLISNPTQAALLVGQIYIPTSGTGKVDYTGLATSAATGIAVSQGSGAAPKITIENTFNAGAPGATGGVSSVFLNGAIYNISGTTTVTNMSGSIAQFAKVETSALTLTAPYGSYFVNQTGIWNLPDPASEWNGLGITGKGSDYGDAFSIATYAANWIYNKYGQYGDKVSFTKYLISPSGLNPIDIGNELGVKNIKENDSSYTYGYGGNHPYRVANDNTFINYYGPFGETDWWVRFSTIDVVGLHTTAGAAAQSSAAAYSGVDVGKSVVINADTININAPITAGRENNVTLRLDQQAQNYVDSYRAWMTNGTVPDAIANRDVDDFRSNPGLYFPLVNGMLSLSRIPQVFGSGLFGDNSVDLFGFAYGNQGQRTGNVGAAFDNRATINGAVNPNYGKVVLADIDASGGGRITLNGRIINTDALGYGKLTVRSGYGNVSINNLTTFGTVLGAINTGTGSQDGIIQITDRNYGNGLGGYLTEWWRNPQGTNTVLHYSNYGNGATAIANATLVNSNDTRSATYNPLPNQRYSWYDNYWATRTFNYAVKDSTVTNWTIPSRYNNLPYRRDAAFIENYYDPAVFRSDVVNATLGYANYSYGYQNVTWKAGDGKITWVNYKIATSAYVQTKSSIKADNPIALAFSGGNSAQVTVGSSADLVLNGNIANGQGYTFLQSQLGNITQNGTTLTSATTLLSAVGSIGSATNPFQIANIRETAAELSATSNAGSVTINNRSGDIRVNNIAAGFGALAGTGDVSLTSAGGILAIVRGAGANITGKTVNLVATGGGIGTANAPLSVATPLVSANALGDIGLRANSGDLNIGAVKSTGGRIDLISSNGAVTSFLPVAADLVAARSADSTLVASLGLLSNNAGQAGVKQYEASVETAYARYWQIQGLLAPGAGARTLTAAGRELLRAQAAAAQEPRVDPITGVSTPVDPAMLSTAQIDLFALGEYDSAKSLLTTAFAADLIASPPAAGTTPVDRLATRQANFDYSVATTDARYGAITYGAKWTPTQLDTVIGGQQNGLVGANIQAQSGIAITANGTTSPSDITINAKVVNNVTTFRVTPTTGAAYDATDTDTTAGHYTATQLRTLLATQGGNATATKVSDSEYSFKIGPKATVSTHTETGTTSVVSNQDFHLEIDGDISLNQLTSAVNGTLYLDSRNGNITNGTAGRFAVVGGLSIKAFGYAGTIDDPLLFRSVAAAQPLNIFQITTGQGFAIQVQNAGAAVGDTTFTGSGSIATSGNISTYVGLDGISRMDGHGGVLTLRTDLIAPGQTTASTQSSIGSLSKPFQAITADGTALSLITNNATLYSPNTTMPASDPALPAIVVPGNLSLAAGTVARDLSITTAGNLGWHAGDTGSIVAGTVTASSLGSIGAEGAPVRFDAPTVSLRTTTTGSIDAALTNSRGAAVNAELLEAGGTLRVTSPGALDVTKASGAAGVQIAATSGNLTVGAVSSRAGAIDIRGAADTAITSATAAAGTITARAAGTLTVIAASGNGLALSGDIVSLVDAFSASTLGTITGRRIETGAGVRFTSSADLTLAATGALALDAATGFADVGKLTLTAGNAAAGGERVVLDRVAADRIVLTTPVGFTIGALVADSSATLTARDGLARISGMSLVPVLTINAADIAAGSLFGRSATLNATGAATIGQVMLQRELTSAQSSDFVFTGNALTLSGLVSAQDNLSVHATSLTGTARTTFLNTAVLDLATTGAMRLDPATTFVDVGAATLSAGSAAAGGTVVTIGSFSGGSLAINAPVGISIGSTTLTKGLTLSTLGAAVINGTVAATGAVNANARSISFGASSQGVIDAGTLNLTAAEMIATTASTNLRSRGVLTVSARDSLAVATVRANGGSITISSGDLAVNNGLTSDGADFRIGVSGTVRLPTATAMAGSMGITAGTDIVLGGATAMNGTGRNATLSLNAGRALTMGSLAGITALSNSANVQISAASVTMDPLTTITGASVSINATGGVTAGDIKANQAAGQLVSLRTSGALSVGQITAGTTLVTAAGGMAVLRGPVNTGDLTVTARDDISTNGIAATSAAINSSTGAVGLGGTTRIRGTAAGAPNATLSVTAATSITLGGPVSAASGMMLMGKSITTTGAGSITDVDGLGAVTTLRADTLNIGFDTGQTTGTALRVDARGYTTANIDDATFRFTTQRAIQFDALFVNKGTIAATTALSYVSKQVRDYLTTSAGTSGPSGGGTTTTPTPTPTPTPAPTPAPTTTTTRARAR